MASGPLRESRDRNVASTFCLLRQRGESSGAAKQTFQNVKKKQKEKIQGQQPPAATAFHPKLRLKIIAARSSQRRLSRSSTEFARKLRLHRRFNRISFEIFKNWTTSATSSSHCHHCSNGILRSKMTQCCQFSFLSKFRKNDTRWRWV